MGSKGPSEKTVTQQTTIPSFLQPLLTGAAGTAGGALSSLESSLGGNTVAGFNRDQRNAFNQIRGIAGGGGGFLPAATDAFLNAAQGGLVPGTAGIDQLEATARGEGLNSDPFLSAFDAAVREITPGINSQFSLAGRSGSGLAATALEQARANAFAGLFGQERQRQESAASTLAGLRDTGQARQLQAAQTLPSLSLLGPQLLQGIGGQQQAQRQRELSGPIQAQQQLLNSAFGGLPIASLLGQSQTTPLFSNPTAGALGGALSGAQLGSSFGPFGTGIGAIGGGLLGGFG